jgi:hypothetical protein
MLANAGIGLSGGVVSRGIVGAKDTGRQAQG